MAELKDLLSSAYGIGELRDFKCYYVDSEDEKIDLSDDEDFRTVEQYSYQKNLASVAIYLDGVELPMPP